ncbi:MAG: hypothetical protein AB1483_06250 [Candidatus Zixiibacteriota bacterium]
MHKLSITVTLFCALMALISAGSVKAEDTDEFKITDYIPERFEDFEWRLGGSIGLSGSDYGRDLIYPEDYRSDISTTNRTTAYWDNDFTTDLNYRYETLTQFFTGRLGLSASYLYNNTNQSRYQDYDCCPAGYSVTQEDGFEKTLEADVRPSVNWGRYLLGDFFASADISLLLGYRERPGGETDYWKETVQYTDTSKSTYTDDRLTESSYIRKDYQISIDIMPGWGRMYVGDYASTALYMIEELRSHGALLREPTRDEMLELTELIYQNRLEHAVDKRIRRIETFDEIIGYFVERGISDASGYYGHLLIEDVWDYFPTYARRFGLRFSAGPGYEYSWYRTNISEDEFMTRVRTWSDERIAGDIDTVSWSNLFEYTSTTETVWSRDVYFRGLAEYSRPLSRQWQLDLSADWRYFFASREGRSYRTTRYRDSQYSDGEHVYSSDTYTRSNEGKIEKQYRLVLDANTDYIYNSRTWLSFGANYMYEKIKYDPDKIYDGWTTDQRDNHILRFDGRLTYRIAISTSFSIRAYYTRSQPDVLTWDDYGTSETNNSYTISASLDHYLY